MTDDVQDVVTQVDKEPVQPAAPAVASTASVDPDDAEVAAALAAADAEAKPAGQPAAAAPAAQPSPAAPQATPQQPAQPQGEGEMIPKARFDEVLGRSAAKDNEIARLQGENQALKMVVKPAAETQQLAAPSPADQLKQVRAERLSLAKKFDDGEMGLVQYETEKQKLEDREDAIREARLVEKFKPAQQAQPQPQASAPDMRLEEKFQELETKHGYLKSPEVMRDDRWQFLLTEAAEQLRAEGVQFPEGLLPPMLRFQLSERVAQLSDTYGPIWGAKAPQAQQPTAPAKPAPMSPQAQARATKLEQAQGAPPDLNRLTPQGGQVEFTEDQIALMSDEEILALPASVRARFSTAS